MFLNFVTILSKNLKLKVTWNTPLIDIFLSKFQSSAIRSKVVKIG